MNRQSFFIKIINKAFLFASMLTCSHFAEAQVLISDFEPYQQDFNTLPVTGVQIWNNNITLPGWFGGYGTATSITNATSVAVFASNGTANALVSYGAAGSSDRALGGKGNTSGNYFIGLRIKNNTNKVIKSFTVSYKAEAYSQTPSYSFSYSTTSTAGLGFGTGTAVTVLNAAAQGIVYKNINGLNIPVGGEIMFRWENTGDYNIAIDDVIVTPSDVDMCFNVSGTTLTTSSAFYSHPDGSVTVIPGTNMGIALVGARTATLGSTIASTTLPTGSKLIIGDGINAVDFTIPSGFSCVAAMDVRNNAKLTLANAVLPALANLSDASTIVYNNATAIPAVSFGNLTIAGARQFSTGTVTVNGILAVNAGSTLTQTGGALVINGQISTGTGTYSLTGGEVQYKASSGTQPVAALAYNNLTIAGSGTKQLQGNAIVNGTLNFAGSDLTSLTPETTLTLGTAANITNEVTANYFKGKMVKSVVINATAGSVNFSNMGLIFNNTGNGNWGTVTVTRTTDAAIINPKDDTKQSIKRSWNIAPSIQAGTNVNMTFKWLTTEDNSQDYGATMQAQPWKSTNGGLTWVPVGNLVAITTTGNERSVNLTTNSFSVWTMSGTNNPLPVSWLYFKGKSTSNGNELNWATATEKNAAEFIVERSADSKNYEAIGKVKAAGNSNQVLTYSFTDKQPLSATAYYRLKQTDFDGTANFSKIIVVAAGAPAALVFELYPNPSAGLAVLQSGASFTASPQVIIFNSQGQVVKELAADPANLKTGTEIDLSAQANGVYIIKIVAENQISVLRMVKQ